MSTWTAYTLAPLDLIESDFLCATAPEYTATFSEACVQLLLSVTAAAPPQGDFQET